MVSKNQCLQKFPGGGGGGGGDLKGYYFHIWPMDYNYMHANDAALVDIAFCIIIMQLSDINYVLQMYRSMNITSFFSFAVSQITSGDFISYI